MEIEALIGKELDRIDRDKLSLQVTLLVLLAFGVGYGIGRYLEPKPVLPKVTSVQIYGSDKELPAPATPNFVN